MSTLQLISDTHTVRDDREERLHRDADNAEDAFFEQLSGNHDAKALSERHRDYGRAKVRQCLYWERRARQAEKLLRATLGTDLTDEQFAAVCAALRVDRRNPRLLTNYEATMIQQYRAMPLKRREMVRTMFELAATAPETEQEKRCGEEETDK